MKIYTRTGDDGTTGLLGGGRVRKCEARIDCFGAVDELNASIGWCAVAADEGLRKLLLAVQDALFTIGSHLAVAEGTGAERHLPALEESMVAQLEMQIDAADARLPELRNFILPGGSEVSARLHLARTVCRRAERRIVEFSLDRPVPGMVVTYLNRLSDWLFVQARAANANAGQGDVVWNAR
ncbi:MAG TPA: cob(I)yrinic acid a,c-diamide adenosyltransferase [Tepidisphaeraceae bacterium]|jgi:cob(I)alamin adenosyltransferase